MRRNIILILLTALTVLGLAGCKKEAVPVESTELATIAPEITKASDELSDKLEEPTKSMTAPTIGTTEAVGSDGETTKIGITETLEDKSYIGITPDNDVVSTLNIPKLSSGHEYTEAEALAVDSLAVYWSENNISKEVLADRLNDAVYSGLSDADKSEIVEAISSANPHNNPDATLPVEEETEGTTESTEAESTAQIDANEALSNMGFDMSMDGIGGAYNDPNLNLQSGN